MLFFGVCFFLYFIKLSAGKGFWTSIEEYTNIQFLEKRRPFLEALAGLVCFSVARPILKANMSPFEHIPRHFVSQYIIPFWFHVTKDAGTKNEDTKRVQFTECGLGGRL